LAAIGAVVIFYGLYNMYNLLFVANLTQLSDLPLYVPLVIVPWLLGILLMLDAAVLRTLHNLLSAAIYVCTNVLWCFAIYELANNLLALVTYVPAYQNAFQYFTFAVLLFIVVVTINVLANRRKRKSKYFKLKLEKDRDET